MKQSHSSKEYCFHIRKKITVISLCTQKPSTQSLHVTIYRYILSDVGSQITRTFTERKPSSPYCGNVNQILIKHVKSGGAVTPHNQVMVLTDPRTGPVIVYHCAVIVTFSFTILNGGDSVHLGAVTGALLPD